MRNIPIKYSLVILAALCGCKQYSETVENVSVDDSNVETISSYEYEYYSGQNAAVAQFGNNNDLDLIVDLNNKKIVSYTSNTDNNGYADGYHKTLDIISNRQNPQCPDLH